MRWLGTPTASGYQRRCGPFGRIIIPSAWPGSQHTWGLVATGKMRPVVTTVGMTRIRSRKSWCGSHDVSASKKNNSPTCGLATVVDQSAVANPSTRRE